MLVRVLKPNRTETNGTATSYNFSTMPKVGEFLRFADGSDFEIVQVGFVQDGGGFVPAIWLQNPAAADPTMADRADPVRRRAEVKV